MQRWLFNQTQLLTTETFEENLSKLIIVQLTDVKDDFETHQWGPFWIECNDG